MDINQAAATQRRIYRAVVGQFEFFLGGPLLYNSNPTSRCQLSLAALLVGAVWPLH